MPFLIVGVVGGKGSITTSEERNPLEKDDNLILPAESKCFHPTANNVVEPKVTSIEKVTV